MFEDCRVEAKSVEDFLKKYYRHDRYHGRGDDYASVVLASHKRDFTEQGYTIISRHESVTGEVVAYFGSRPTIRAADGITAAQKFEVEGIVRKLITGKA